MVKVRCPVCESQTNPICANLRWNGFLPNNSRSCGCRRSYGYYCYGWKTRPNSWNSWKKMMTMMKSSCRKTSFRMKRRNFCMRRSWSWRTMKASRSGSNSCWGCCGCCSKNCCCGCSRIRKCSCCSWCSMTNCRRCSCCSWCSMFRRKNLRCGCRPKTNCRSYKSCCGFRWCRKIRTEAAAAPRFAGLRSAVSWCANFAGRW